MIDREKVISQLEEEVRHGKHLDEIYCTVYMELLENALLLLKEQDAREPHYTTLRYLVNGMEVAVRHPECPRCIENGLVLWDADVEEGQAYCKRCGQALKWE